MRALRPAEGRPCRRQRRQAEEEKAARPTRAAWPTAPRRFPTEMDRHGTLQGVLELLQKVWLEGAPLVVPRAKDGPGECTPSCKWEWHGDHAYCLDHGLYHHCTVVECGRHREREWHGSIHCPCTGRHLGFASRATWDDKQRGATTTVSVKKRTYANAALRVPKTKEEMADAAHTVAGLPPPRKRRRRVRAHALLLVGATPTSRRPRAARLNTQEGNQCMSEGVGLALTKYVAAGCSVQRHDVPVEVWALLSASAASFWQLHVEIATRCSMDTLNRFTLESCVLLALHTMAQNVRKSTVLDRTGRIVLPRLSWFLAHHPYVPREAQKRLVKPSKRLTESRKCSASLLSVAEDKEMQAHYTRLSRAISVYRAAMNQPPQ